VEVDVEVEARAESLDEGDGSGSATGDSGTASFPSLPGEDGAKKYLQHGS